MLEKKRRFASLALPAIGALCACCVLACRKESPSTPENKGPEAGGASVRAVAARVVPEAMPEAEYRAELSKWEAAQVSLAKRQAMLNKRRSLLEQEMRGDRAAMEKLPEYQELQEQSKANAAEFFEVREKLTALIRARARQKAASENEISKVQEVK